MLAPSCKTENGIGPALVLVVAAFLLAIQAVPSVLIQDGPLLLSQQVHSDHEVPVWNHLAAQPLAWAATNAFWWVPERDVMEGLSATYIGLSALLLARLLALLNFGPATTSLAVAILLGSRGSLLHSSIIELHGLQLLGSLLAANIATLRNSRTKARTVGTAMGAGFLAIACHRANVLLLPALCAAPLLLTRARNRSSFVSSLLVALGFSIGTLLATTANGLLGAVDSAGTVSGSFSQVSRYWTGGGGIRLP